MARKPETAIVDQSRIAIPPEVLFGLSSAMRSVRRTTERVSGVRVPVLVEGESGTGKEALANYLHSISPWNENPFVKVNCAAVPGPLLESELFGYEKGAFTGAYTSRPGKFEQANGGTLMLDEIGEMDNSLQAKLLHALQDGRFSRIGDTEERFADVRIISVTNRNIGQEIANGTFREDLFYRINVMSIVVPPLRERIEDLPVLIDYFLEAFRRQFQRDVAPIPGELMERFRSHKWPGNIRELENYLKAYVIMGGMDGVLAELRERNQPVAGGFHLRRPDDFSLKRFAKTAAMEAERFLILEALKETRWNRHRASKLLGVSYRALLYKMRDAGLPSKKRPRIPAGAASPAEGSATLPEGSAPLPE